MIGVAARSGNRNASKKSDACSNYSNDDYDGQVMSGSSETEEVIIEETTTSTSVDEES